MPSPLGERGSILKSNVFVPWKNIQKFKSFHPRVSINVEFQLNLGGKLLRSSTYSITPEKWKIISPMDEAGSQVQDDCLVTERRKAFSHDSTQLASDQRDNVLDPMKSKLRPVSVKTTVESCVVPNSRVFCKYPFCNHKSSWPHLYDVKFIWLIFAISEEQIVFHFILVPKLLSIPCFKNNMC